MKAFKYFNNNRYMFQCSMDPRMDIRNPCKARFAQTNNRGSTNTTWFCISGISITP